ncbi:hypothetical protein F4677DRAFT_97147 [Hypoxylon crocopeplum]|nr:hypothetical protein F4677DRAFT_97147 [Hypoxylon crocopeplum]
MPHGFSASGVARGTRSGRTRTHARSVGSGSNFNPPLIVVVVVVVVAIQFLRTTSDKDVWRVWLTFPTSWGPWDQVNPAFSQSCSKARIPQLEVTDHTDDRPRPNSLLRVIRMEIFYGLAVPSSPTCSGKASSVKTKRLSPTVIPRMGIRSVWPLLHQSLPLQSRGHRQLCIRYPLFAPSYIRSALVSGCRWAYLNEFERLLRTNELLF